MSETTAKKKSIWRSLGPGLVTGAADDDPSGIATYTIAGAQLGTSLLWSALLTWPLMGAVQMMCARIGMVTGKGLASAFDQKFPRALLVLFCVALFAANTLNIAADLAAMADAITLLAPVNSRLMILVMGLAIGAATVFLRYQQIALILKWLALFLLAYVIAAFSIGPDWGAALHDTFLPQWPQGREAWQTLVAILGTTISPYLFFWQSAQEVEEKNAGLQKGSLASRLTIRRWDVGIGTFASNLVMYFVILTAALTLHANGKTDIQTSREAAEALGPLAGPHATWLYTLGLIGVGLLAIPTLAGSAAYAFAETFRWKQGLDAKFDRARAFYAVVLVSILVAIMMDFADLNPVRTLFWSAVVNGLLAPFLLVGILIVASDTKIMKGQVSSRLSRIAVGLTTLLMFGAGLAIFL